MKEKLKAISIAIIITGILLSIGYFINHVFNYFLKEERPNELCEKMQEISDNQTLVGLSKKEVEETLGEPVESYNDKAGNIYIYYGGKMDTGLFWGNTTIFFDYEYSCEFRIFFNENDIVKSTAIKLIP